MDKEKDMRKIANAICRKIKDLRNPLKGYGNVATEIASAIVYKYGYRNAEEVRKQTVNEFAELLKSKMKVQGFGIDLKAKIFTDIDMDNLVKEFLTNEIQT